MPMYSHSIEVNLELSFANGRTMSVSFGDNDLDDPKSSYFYINLDERYETEDVFEEGITRYVHHQHLFEDEDFEFDITKYIGDEDIVEALYYPAPLSQLINCKSLEELKSYLVNLFKIHQWSSDEILKNLYTNVKGEEYQTIPNDDQLIDVVHIDGEDQIKNVEQLCPGDKVNFIQPDPHRSFGSRAIEVISEQGVLGNVPSKMVDLVYPILKGYKDDPDEGYIVKVSGRVQAMTPLSERSKAATKPLLKISCVYTLINENGIEKEFSTLGKLYDFILKMKKNRNSEQFDQSAQDNINQIVEKNSKIADDYKKLQEGIVIGINNNMITLDDLMEVSLELQDFTTYRHMNDWDAKYLFENIFGSNVSTKMQEVYEMSDGIKEKLIDGLKTIEGFNLLNDDAIALLSEIYLKNPQQEAADYAAKQTWKRGEKIQLEIEFYKEPEFGI